MDKVEITVTGVPAINAAFARVEKKLSKNEMQKYCMYAGFMFEESAKWYASGNGGGPQVQTGNLRASIQTEPTDDGGATVAPHADYAPYVEFGVPGHSSPYPYMRPAYETTLQPARSFLMEKIGKEVEIGYGE